MPKISPKLPLVMSNEGGYTFTKTVSEAVEQNFKNLILTVPGERVMDPEFGVGLYRYLFQNAVPATFEAIRARIYSQTSKYLPFVDIHEIEMGGADEENFNTTSNFLAVKIVYSIESSDEVNILTLSTDKSTN